MKKLMLAVMAVALTACSTLPDYRALASRTVPTNVELYANITNPLSELVSESTYCSGTIVTPTHIITAGHCVDGARDENREGREFLKDGKILVKTQDGRTFLAKIVAHINTDDENVMDAALLVVEEGGLGQVAEIGDSDSLQQGSFLAIVGNPWGEMKFSFETGHVGYVSRKLPFGTFIQAYLESRGGNSGGGAFDSNGRLVGIVVRSDRAGFTFIIPINAAFKAIMEKVHSGA